MPTAAGFIFLYHLAGLPLESPHCFPHKVQTPPFGPAMLFQCLAQIWLQTHLPLTTGPLHCVRAVRGTTIAPSTEQPDLKSIDSYYFLSLRLTLS